MSVLRSARVRDASCVRRVRSFCASAALAVRAAALSPSARAIARASASVGTRTTSSRLSAVCFHGESSVTPSTMCSASPGASEREERSSGTSCAHAGAPGCARSCSDSAPRRPSVSLRKRSTTRATP